MIGGEVVEAGLWQLFFLLLAGLNFFMGVFNLLLTVTADIVNPIRLTQKPARAPLRAP